MGGKGLASSRTGLSCLLACVVVTLASCGAPAASTGTPKPLAFSQQNLTVGLQDDEYISKQGVVLGIWPYATGVAETLVGLSSTFQPVPLLATSWNYIGNNTWQFHLRQGVKFQDGAPLNALAVKYSLDRTVTKKLTLTTFLGPNSTTVVDDYTVNVTPTRFNGQLPQQLAHPFFSIIAVNSDPATKPVGTGPFQFVSYTPSQQIVVSRFAGYWGTKAKLNQITFKFIPDDTTRTLALESGAVDVAVGIPAEQSASVAQQKGLRVLPAPPGAIYVASLNSHGKAPYTILADATVRKALAMSFDPSQIVNQLWHGNASVVHTLAPPAMLGQAASLVKGIPTDLTQAESLLSQDGWTPGSDGIRVKNGQRLSLSTIAQVGVDSDALQELQSQAKQAGIELKINLATDTGVFSTEAGSGAYDIDINFYNQNDANPARIETLFFYSQSTQAGVQYVAPGGTFDTEIEQALQATTTEGTIQAAAQAMHQLVDVDVAAIPFASQPVIYADKTKVEGFSAPGSANYTTWNTTFLTQ